MNEQQISPLLVRCQARSGSTWLMRCLSQIDGIAVALHPPCEVRYAQYMSAAFDVMTGSADLDESSRPNFFHLDKGEKWIGRNPFNRRLAKGYHRYFSDRYESEFRAFFIDRIREFYAEVARINGVSGKYFCEKAFYISRKAWQQSPDEIFHLYPESVRAIYLVRDPRDIFCSNQAFFHGDESPEDDRLLSAMRGLGRHMDAMADAYLQKRREQKLIVRYERMVDEPVEVLGEVCDWLGTEQSSQALRNATRYAQNQQSSRHRTTRNAKASVRRWKDDLTGLQLEHANGYFEKYRETFRYE